MAVPTLLVVDPDEGARQELAGALQVSGYTVVSVPGAGAAVALCLTARPSGILVGDSLSDAEIGDLTRRIADCCWDMPPVVLIATDVPDQPPAGVDHVFARDPRQHGALLRLLEAVAAPPQRGRRHGSGVMPRQSDAPSAPPRSSSSAMRQTGVRGRSGAPPAEADSEAPVFRIPLRKRRRS